MAESFSRASTNQQNDGPPRLPRHQKSHDRRHWGSRHWCVLAAPNPGRLYPSGPILIPWLSTTLWSYLNYCRYLMPMLVAYQLCGRLHYSLSIAMLVFASLPRSRISPHFTDTWLGQMTYFGQWTVIRCDVNQGLKCTLKSSLCLYMSAIGMKT